MVLNLVNFTRFVANSCNYETKYRNSFPCHESYLDLNFRLVGKS